MRKLFNFLFALVLCVCVSFVLVGCSKPTPKEKTFTVTFYDGEAVLKTETVNDGEKVASWIPTKEGYTFLGWFGTPSFSKEYDFEQPVTEDRSIFGKFQEDVYVEDTRTWYIVGSGTGKVLLDSKWGKVFNDVHKLNKSNTERANEFTITVDLFEGDEFQFALNENWHNQRGGGYLETTSKDGVEHFQIAGNIYSTQTKKSNIKVLVSGNYTLTLTTFPNEDYYDDKDSYYTEATKESFNYSDFDKITWVRNGDCIEKLSSDATNFYIKGSKITGWAETKTDEFKMTYDSAKKEYSYTHQFYANDEFMFYSDGAAMIKNDVIDYENSTSHIVGEAGKATNIKVDANGTYTFVYNEETKKCVVTYDEKFDLQYVVNETWYILGNGTTGLLKKSNWGKAELTDEFKLQPVEGQNYTYSITLNLQVGDEFAICKDSSWGLKHVFDFVENPVVDEVEYFTKSGNIKCAVAGNYTLTLVCSEESMDKDKITWVRNGDCIDSDEEPEVKQFDVYIKGTMTEWKTVNKSVSKDGIATFYYAFNVNDEFGFAWFDESTTTEWGNWIGSTGVDATSAKAGMFNLTANNIKCVEAGFVKVVVDYTSTAPVVKFEAAPNYEVIIKGTMTSWNASEKYQAVNGIVTINYTFKANDEFGFAWFDESTTTEWGNYINTAYLQEGDVNATFDGTNNYKCTVAGNYVITISFLSGQPAVDFKLAE